MSAVDRIKELSRLTSRAVTETIGGHERTRIVVVLACVLGLSSADASTVGAAATALRHSLHIDNTDIGLLVSVTSATAALASIPFGALADRFRRTWLLGGAIVLWGAAMLWSAAVPNFGQLLLSRACLGAISAVAGPAIASLVGDYFEASERGRIYGFVLAGELVGSGIGFAVTGEFASLSWRFAFVVLALPAFVLAWFVFRLKEPKRGGHRGGAAQERTDAQKLAADRGVEADADRVLDRDPRRMHIIAAARYVFTVRTNVVLIVSGACGYFFLAGVQTFGIEFASRNYGIPSEVANLVLLIVGIGAVGGVLVGGALSDRLLRHGVLNARLIVPAVAAGATFILFVPPLFTHSTITAVPYLMAAAFALSAQNPALDAARLDVVVPLLWGRAEGVRTFLRTAAQALAPLLFGLVSDYVFGGGHNSLKWTFVIMLLPLLASCLVLVAGIRWYPRDVATAAAARMPSST
jgi:MFS family permease